MGGDMFKSTCGCNSWPDKLDGFHFSAALMPDLLLTLPERCSYGSALTTQHQNREIIGQEILIWH